MAAYVHEASGLVKAVWSSHRDLSALRWRGCTIHAVSFGQYEDNRVQIHDDGTVDTEFDDLDDTAPWHFLHLDIDYIVSRTEPETPEQQPAFWIAPATLHFSDAEGVDATIGIGSTDRMRLEPGITTTDLVISEMQRIGPEDDSYPRWRIAGKGFEIRFRSDGFLLAIRTEPRLAGRSSLGLAERGGVSFAPQPFA